MTYAEELAREISRVDFDAETVREVLNAIAALAERGGPKLVLREPTEAMLDAVELECSTVNDDWNAMFDAAPAVPGGSDA